MGGNKSCGSFDLLLHSFAVSFIRQADFSEYKDACSIPTSALRDACLDSIICQVLESAVVVIVWQ